MMLTSWWVFQCQTRSLVSYQQHLQAQSIVVSLALSNISRTAQLAVSAVSVILTLVGIDDCWLHSQGFTNLWPYILPINWRSWLSQFCQYIKINLRRSSWHHDWVTTRPCEDHDIVIERQRDPAKIMASWFSDDATLW
jgi:hypothetical protein